MPRSPNAVTQEVALTETAPKRAAADFERATEAADQTVASFEGHGRGPLQHLQHFLHSVPTTIPLAVLILSVLVFGYFGYPRFLTVSTLSIIVAQCTIIAMIGVAQTLVILTAGVDLSVGAITVLVTVVLGGLTVGDNAILPGWIATDMTAGAQENKAFADKVIPRVPARRWGEPADFGGMAVYLASDASSYHSGDTLVIDGGYAIF